MSLHDWKMEFYPEPAEIFCLRAINQALAGHTEPSNELALAALKHSENKWRGALPKNLKKHGLKKTGSCSVAEPGNEDCEFLQFGSDGCSLCHISEGFILNTDVEFESHCDACPIKIITGMSCIDGKNPYREFSFNEDPKPMIKVLKLVRKVYELRLANEVAADKRRETLD